MTLGWTVAFDITKTVRKEKTRKKMVHKKMKPHLGDAMGLVQAIDILDQVCRVAGKTWR